MSDRSIHIENLKFLTRKYRTQTALAKNLKQKITQPVISTILNTTTGRHLSPYEARCIEDELVIPHGWMSRPSLEKAWPLAMKFQVLDATSRNIVNEMVRFMSEKPAIN